MDPSVMLIPLIVSSLSSPQNARNYNPAVVLEITSPSEGAIVEPGRPLIVTVNSSTVRDAEFIVGSPLGMSSLISSLPGRAIIDIAKDAKCGRHQITAMGNTRAGQPIVSNTINIDVERSDMPISLSEINQLLQVTFDRRGEEIPLIIVATFADGAVLDVNESTYMRYSSTNPRVAAVNEFGMITSTGVGHATIRAEYRKGAARRTLEVAVDVPSSPDAQIPYDNMTCVAKGHNHRGPGEMSSRPAADR